MSRRSILLLMISLCFFLGSCATAFHPVPATAYQKRRPAPGQPSRDIRVGFLIADILFGGVPLLIDLASHQIYKPSPSVAARKKIK